MEGKKLGTIGDVNPIEYGGGIIFDDEYYPTLEYTHGLEADGEALCIYRVNLDADIFDFHDWVDYEDLALAMEISTDELLVIRNSNCPLARASVIEAIGHLYGWGELDWYPLTMSEQELAQRWDE